MHNNIRTTIFAGKGGVGKSTLAASKAINSAYSGTRTRLADLDGGRSIPRMLEFTENESGEGKKRLHKNLIAHVVDPFEFVSIIGCKKQGRSFDDYMTQFKDDHGLVAFCDMITTFFGCPTDIATTQKFTTLVEHYQSWARYNVEHVVLDVEPTEGLRRLLTNSASITRSLRNLEQTGILALGALGVRWPDIAAYLRSSYIKQAQKYCARMEICVSHLRTADYFLVCIPEHEPIAQMVDVDRVITGFGATPRGIIINRCRNKAHEDAAIARIALPYQLKRIDDMDEIHVVGRNNFASFDAVGEALTQHFAQ
jgi:anion-transporting  ArsA/GET3 family ATPase